MTRVVVNSVMYASRGAMLKLQEVSVSPSSDEDEENEMVRVLEREMAQPVLVGPTAVQSEDPSDDSVERLLAGLLQIENQ